MKSTAHFPQLSQEQQPKPKSHQQPNSVFEVPVTVTLPKRGTFLLSLTRHTSGSFNRNRHNPNRRIGLYESPCLEVMNLVLVSLSPPILNRQHAHKQTKELGHDGNGQSTFSGSSRKSLSLSNHICLIALNLFKKLPAPPKRLFLEASQEVEILAIASISYI